MREVLERRGIERRLAGSAELADVRHLGRHHVLAGQRLEGGGIEVGIDDVPLRVFLVAEVLVDRDRRSRGSAMTIGRPLAWLKLSGRPDSIERKPVTAQPPRPAAGRSDAVSGELAGKIVGERDAEKVRLIERSDGAIVARVDELVMLLCISFENE